MSRAISPFTKGIIVGLKTQGLSDRQVSENLDILGKSCERSAVNKIWKRWTDFREYGDQRQLKSGRKKELNEEEVRNLKDFVIENPGSSRKQLENNPISNPKDLSYQTLANYLHKEDVVQVSARQIIQISEENKKLRVKWARKMLRGNITYLKNAIFQDETWITYQNTYNQKIWVDKRENDYEIPTKEYKRWPQKVLIWACININGPLQIQIIEGSLNGQSYQKVLEKFFIDDGFIDSEFSAFQHDNAKAHISYQVQQFLDENEIETFDWPSQSPDFNPIESVWFLLKHIVTKKLDDVEDFYSLKNYIINIFMNDPQIKECIINSIKKLPEILSQVIAKQGNIIV